MDVNYAMKIEDTVKIKKLETELGVLKLKEQQFDSTMEKNKSMKLEGKELMDKYKALKKKC